MISVAQLARATQAADVHAAVMQDKPAKALLQLQADPTVPYTPMGCSQSKRAYRPL